MIISHLHKFIFVKTRKTAGSSIEIALSKYLGSADLISPCMPVEEEVIRKELGFRGAQNYALPLSRWGPKDYIDFVRGHKPKLFRAHSNAQDIAGYLNPDDFRRYKKILTVRNPYTYVVSLYNWHDRHSGPSQEGFKEWLIAGAGDLRFSNYAMGKVNGRFVMDIVLKFETIQVDLARLGRTLGLPSDLLQLFNSINAKVLDSADQLTVEEAYESFPGARSLVESRFEEEILTFDYRFPC